MSKSNRTKPSAEEARGIKSVMKLLDGAQRKHGLFIARKAASRWVEGQRARSRLAKERAALEKQLAEVNQRLA